MTEPDVIILVKEREKRRPEKGDAYIRETGRERGQIDTAKYDFSFPRTCYTKRDLTPPEGAISADLVWINSSGGWFDRVHISLPRPKVKRWQWRCEHVAGKILWRTEGHHSEEEIRAAYPQDFSTLRPIPETEVSE